jgi:hypothetical protein
MRKGARLAYTGTLKEEFRWLPNKNSGWFFTTRK